MIELVFSSKDGQLSVFLKTSNHWAGPITEEKGRAERTVALLERHLQDIQHAMPKLVEAVLSKDSGVITLQSGFWRDQSKGNI